MHLSEENGAELIKLARDAIENYLIKKVTITAQQNITTKYNEKAGIFVTLNHVRNNSEAIRSGVGICFMTYVASYILARWFIGQHLPPTDYRKMVTTGLAGYVFMFLVVWILYNTSVMAGQTG